MISDERYAANARLHEAVRQLRGRLLNHVAVIDVDISLILSAYFAQVPARQDRLMSDVFSDPAFGLRRKADLLKRIVKADYAELLRDADEHFVMLRRLLKFRNTLAHAKIDVSEQAHAKADEQVGFISFRDGQPQTTVVTFAEANEYYAMSGSVSGWLHGFEQLLDVKLSR